MDDGRWLQRNLVGMQAAFRTFALSAGAQLLELDSIVATVNPAVRERSVFNSVIYLDPEALADAYQELAAVYAQAGCAWTVWAPEGDTATTGLLEGAGHTLDAQPRAMGLELAGVEEPDLSGLDWSDGGEVKEMTALNDGAYGYPIGTWRRGIGPEPEGMRIYLARVDGEPAATVGAIDAGDDCSIWCVATAESARGRGLCTALMRRAIFDAAQRGRSSSTLQATKLGAPVYRRCGYLDFGAIGMWEQRPIELAAEAHPRPAA
jgi:GNAT superfamily N-acetyltransferase